MGCLVEEKYPEFFVGEVAQQRVENFINIIGRTYDGVFRMFLQFSAFSQFKGCHDGYAFGGSKPFETGEIVHFPFP